MGEAPKGPICTHRDGILSPACGAPAVGELVARFRDDAIDYNYSEADEHRLNRCADHGPADVALNAKSPNWAYTFEPYASPV